MIGRRVNDVKVEKREEHLRQTHGRFGRLGFLRVCEELTRGNSALQNQAEPIPTSRGKSIKSAARKLERIGCLDFRLEYDLK